MTKEKSKQPPAPIFKNIGNSKIEFPNLMPLLRMEYRGSMMNTLKNWFCSSLLVAVSEERTYCKEHKEVPGPFMTQDKIDRIQSILDQCKDVYEIQALSNFVFLENQVPESYEEVKNRGFNLRIMYPQITDGGRR